MGGPGSGRKPAKGVKKRTPEAPKPGTGFKVAEFRALNPAEEVLFGRVVKRAGRRNAKEKMDGMSVGYVARKGHTQCILMKDKYALFTGHTYRNPIDPKNPVAGKRLAFARAVTYYLNSIPRAVGKPDKQADMPATVEIK